jgi:pimeloyl-ACP methyl ester carboxylesterase
MARIETPDGNTIAVHDLGGDGPPLLLAHATGFHGHVWDPVASHLADRFHCWSFDERGHGDSGPAPGEDYDWNGFATDVLAVIDDLAPGEPLRAAGHSCGGALLLLAEQRRPGTFSALWTYEPVMMPSEVPLPTGTENPLATGARRRRAEFPSKQAAFDNFAGKPPFDRLHPDALWAYVDHGFVEKDDGTARLKCEPEREARTYEMSLAHDAFAKLVDVACPVRVVCGEKTDAFPEAVIRAVADRLPRGTAEVMPGLSHFGPLEDPAAVAASISRALARD